MNKAPCTTDFFQADRNKMHNGDLVMIRFILQFCCLEPVPPKMNRILNPKNTCLRSWWALNLFKQMLGSPFVTGSAAASCAVKLALKWGHQGGWIRRPRRCLLTLEFYDSVPQPQPFHIRAESTRLIPYTMASPHIYIYIFQLYTYIFKCTSHIFVSDRSVK